MIDIEKVKTLAIILGIPPEKLVSLLEGNEEHFYYNPNVFMKLHSIDYEGLRKLVVPNLKKLRR
jgi:hypothetical protein